MTDQIKKDAMRSGGNGIPTILSVREKVARRGALFATDEVQVLCDEIDRLVAERVEMLATVRELQRKYVRTDSA